MEKIRWQDPKSGEESCISVQDITEIIPGCNTPVFARFKKVQQTKSNQCFSLKTKERTLDLEMESKAQRGNLI
jgi:hypothetical protein